MLPIKKTPCFFSLLLFLFLIAPFFAANAQPLCNNGKFYGKGNSGSGNIPAVVYSFTINGNTVTYHGPVTSATTNANPASLAIADLGDGATFYSNDLSNNVLKYNGQDWDTVYTNTELFFNAAGNGHFLYYQGSPNSPSTNNIQKLENGVFNTIWEYGSIRNGLQDIACDDSGNVYFLTSINNTSTADTIRVISPTGVTLQVMPLSVSINTNNGYGCFMINNVFYIGIGPNNSNYPNTLLPITLNGSTATVGTPIPMPVPMIGTTPLSMSDLASCGNIHVVLPVTFRSVKAYQKNNSVTVDWEIESELNIVKYVVQKSFSGSDFTDAGSVTANNNTSYSFRDVAMEKNTVFYRIKSFDAANKNLYSAIVKVSEVSNKQNVSIYPNPASNQAAVLHFNNFTKGKYDVRIINQAGQNLFTQSVLINGTYNDLAVPLQKNLNAGLYFVQVIETNSIVQTLKLVVL